MASISIAALSLSYAADFGYVGKRFFAIAGGGLIFTGDRLAHFPGWIWITDRQHDLDTVLPGGWIERDFAGTTLAIPIWPIALAATAIAFWPDRRGRDGRTPAEGAITT